MKKKSKNTIIGLFVALALIFGGGEILNSTTDTKVTYNETNEQSIKNENVDKKESTQIVNNSEEDLKVHFIDVGQGDSIFIELPNDEVMLIDAGESSEEEKVYNYITDLGYNNIDYVVGTHPHTDHIGGLEYIINNISVENIYMPKAVSTSKTYESLLNTISNKNLKVKVAKANVSIISSDNLSVNIIAPNSESYSNLNNYSAVIKIDYYNNSFLFMGDAEVLSEEEITSDVGADVIKVGHHGSDSSSSLEFLNKVKPKYAVISVGTNNQYNHPYDSILSRYESIGAQVYRTDLHGTIVATSDGTNINITKEK